jgi:CTP:molybdopterin cytidylyltransferase MocA
MIERKDKRTIYGIVVAAGRSRRMGAPKALLPFEGRTFIEAVVEALMGARPAGVLLVLNNDLAERLPASVDGQPRTVNSDPESGMIDSVRIGLSWWQQHADVQEGDGFLVCPVDAPGVQQDDVARCAAAWRAKPNSIIIAEHEGRRGHPIIFGSRWLECVRGPLCDAGLRELPRSRPEAVVGVPCASPGVARNINTPSDYTVLGEDAGADSPS